jgi:hypothetical protein
MNCVGEMAFVLLALVFLAMSGRIGAHNMYILTGADGVQRDLKLSHMREHFMSKYIEERIQTQGRFNVSPDETTRNNIATCWHHAVIVWEFIDAIDTGSKEKHTEEIERWKLTAEAMASAGKMGYTDFERADTQEKLRELQADVIVDDTLTLTASISSYIVASTQEFNPKRHTQNLSKQPSTILLLNKCMIAACKELIHVHRLSHSTSAIQQTIEILEHLVGFQAQKRRENDRLSD